MEIYGNVNVSSNINTPELTNEITYTLLSGINFSLEQSADFGAFVEPGSNKLLNLDYLATNECVIYHKFSKEINYKENDTIEIRMSLVHEGIIYERVKNFTITKVFDYQLKWPISYENRHLIVVDIEALYELFGYSTFHRKCNKLIMTLSEPEKFYDVRDLERSENNIKDLAGDIQMVIGLEEYYIDLPKLEVLGFSEWLSVGITTVSYTHLTLPTN